MFTPGLQLDVINVKEVAEVVVPAGTEQTHRYKEPTNDKHQEQGIVWLHFTGVAVLMYACNNVFACKCRKNMQSVKH